MTTLCCLIRKVKMTKILVVGLAVILAAAGSGRADSTTGQSGTSATSGSAGSSGSAHSSGSGVVRPGAVAPSNRGGSAPVVRQYPTSMNVQNAAQPNLLANWRVQRRLDRSELLARQSFYYRNRVNPATVQGPNQSTANPGQVRAGGQVPAAVPSQGLIPRRHNRDGENNSQNATGGTPATGSRNGTMEVTNSRIGGDKPVLNFNNANTMNFTDACRRHRDRHDRDWWQNHCHTIILIGGGFYAWDLGYWYPA